MKKAKLIVLEGTDGAGKSTQLNLIKKYLDENNLKYAHLHFPMYGHNEFSEVIAKFLQGDFGGIDDVDPYFVANIYAMDRYMFLPELEKLMKENDVVILDRYVLSNMAFQAAKYRNKEDSLKIKKWIYDLEFDFLNLPYPDLTIFFDVPMDIASERLSKRNKEEDREYLEGKDDIHEADMNFQSRVRDTYISLKGLSYYYIVKTTQISGDFGDTHQIVLSPEELFLTYKYLIKDTINGL